MLAKTEPSFEKEGLRRFCLPHSSSVPRRLLETDDPAVLLPDSQQWRVVRRQRCRSWSSRDQRGQALASNRTPQCGLISLRHDGFIPWREARTSDCWRMTRYPELMQEGISISGLPISTPELAKPNSASAPTCPSRNSNLSVCPLAYRGQRVYVVLGYRGHKTYEQTFRSCAGHARHAAAENSRS